MIFGTQRLLDALQTHKTEVAHYIVRIAGLQGECAQLEIQNTRLRSDLDWFKMRLNAVEKERAQLIAAAIGVKIAIPEFIPTGADPATALSELPDMSTVGQDAKDDEANGRALVPATDAVGDYSMLPGYERQR